MRIIRTIPSLALTNGPFAAVTVARFLRTTKVVRLLAAASLTGSCFVAFAATAASVGMPTVTVNPSTGLVHGESVMVRVHRLPPNVAAGLAECDDSFIELGPPEGPTNCSQVGTVHTNGNGGGAARVSLVDVAIGGDPISPHEVYCRADVCRMWVWWHDGSGAFHAASSSTMEFVGAPATVSANATDVVNGQRVKVHGTAYGAEGATVAVYEGVCATYHGTSCRYLFRRSTVVRPNGTWNTVVRVSLHLPDGDCVAPGEPFDGSCELEARVLDAAGNVDEGFAVPDIGDVGWPVRFPES